MRDYYYQVGSITYESKIAAILQASVTREEVTWNFHNYSFSNHNWLVEPAATLDELYKLRALQIRNQYDYVVILCSGGADSTNMLYSFLNNGIKIDEIIASAPMDGLRDYSFNTQDSSHSNTMSETRYAQIPLMQEIARLHPEIKITMNDYFNDIINYKADQWILDCDDWIHPSSAARYRFEKHIHLRNLADRGKSIGFVYGIDKPNILLDINNSIYLSFADHAVNVMRSPFDRFYPNVDNVMFYWDPSNLDCLSKQAHLVAKWIFKPENKTALSYMFSFKQLPANYEVFRYRQSKYERAIIPCIYTNVRKVFQAEKPIKIFLGEHDAWFYKHHTNTTAYEMMISDTKHLFSQVHPKFINKGNNGFKMFCNYYLIGNLKDFYEFII